MWGIYVHMCTKYEFSMSNSVLGGGGVHTWCWHQWWWCTMDNSWLYKALWLITKWAKNPLSYVKIFHFQNTQPPSNMFKVSPCHCTHIHPPMNSYDVTYFILGNTPHPLNMSPCHCTYTHPPMNSYVKIFYFSVISYANTCSDSHKWY